MTSIEGDLPIHIKTAIQVTMMTEINDVWTGEQNSIQHATLRVYCIVQ